jgi:hypothetical protein
MDDLRFLSIDESYNNFYRELLKKGRLAMWSTEKGFWSASISGEVYEAFRKIGLGRTKSFIDLGSGDGKVVLIASLFCKKAAGIEIDPFLHKKAIETQKRLRIPNAAFINGDFAGHNISQYDFVFLAPDAPLERGLELKLLCELKGKLILYGNHFHPSILRKEIEFSLNGTGVCVFSNEKP